MKPEFIRQGRKLSEARLAEVEKKCGIQLPKDYRDFMLDKNGGKPEPDGVCRKRSKTPYMTCQYLFSIDAERDYEDWIWMFGVMKDEDEPRLPVRLIPIGDDGGGNTFCLSVSGKDMGKVFWSDHENFFVPDPPRRVFPDMTGISLVADSFEKFLSQFAAEPDDHPEIKSGDWVRPVKKRDVKSVASWLDKGGKWDEFDMKTGRTPLMLSIELGDREIVNLLLDRGASVQEALNHAIIVNAWDIVRALLKRISPGTASVDSTVFARALEGCTDASIIKGLLGLGAPIHGEFYGLNPLYSATVHGGSPEVVKLLLNHGAKLEQSSDKQSALANAIANGQLETAKLLLDAGEDLYKAPQKKTKKEVKLEGQIKDEESKSKPDKKLIEMYAYFLDHERNVNKPRAPIYSFDHPWKKFPPNFKKDVIAYAAKLGQKPSEAQP